MTSLNVTIVAHEVATLGGMEAQLGILVKGLLDAGVCVTVIARRCALAPHPLLTVIRVPTPRRPFPIGYPLFAIAASLWLRQHPSGIVHTTGAIILPAVDCVTVHFCHAAYHEIGSGPRPAAPGRLRQLSAQISHKMAVLAERWCYRATRARSLVAVSPGVRDEIQQYFPDLADRVQTIPHGVDSDRFKPDPVARQAIRTRHGLSAEDLVAVFVGGDWKRKRLDHAIDAVAQTERWTLLVVGGGHRGEYMQRAHEQGVAERVHFAGLTDDVPAYLAAGDVFVLPTEYETFCLVAFEAAAVGLPVLVTPVSGPDMLIEPGVNGDFLDSDARRTALLLDAYADKDRRRVHGDAARERARLFTWDQATAAYISVYQRLAGVTVGESGPATSRQY